MPRAIGGGSSGSSARGAVAYRELIVLPYRVIYRVEPREVWIVAVLDHRRDLDTVLRQRARRDG